jgi:hypothetical protein
MFFFKYKTFIKKIIYDISRIVVIFFIEKIIKKLINISVYDTLRVVYMFF